MGSTLLGGCTGFFSKKVLYNPLMGCFPFANYHFLMGVTTMGFAEHFGHWEFWSIKDIEFHLKIKKILQLLSFYCTRIFSFEQNGNNLLEAKDMYNKFALILYTLHTRTSLSVLILFSCQFFNQFSLFLMSEYFEVFHE